MADRPQLLDRRAESAVADAKARAQELTFGLDHSSPEFNAAQALLIEIALMQWFHRGAQDAIDRIQRSAK